MKRVFKGIDYMGIFRFNLIKKYLIILSIAAILSFIIFISNFVFFMNSYASKRDYQPDIVSGVVPHHLLAKNMIEDFFKYIST